MEITPVKVFDKAPKKFAYATRVNKVQVWEYSGPEDKTGILTFEATGVDAYEEAHAYMSVVMTALFPKTDPMTPVAMELSKGKHIVLYPALPIAPKPLPHQTRQWELKSTQEVVWQ